MTQFKMILMVCLLWPKLNFNGCMASKALLVKHRRMPEVIEPVIETRILNPLDSRHEGKYADLINQNAGGIIALIIYKDKFDRVVRTASPIGRQALAIIAGFRAKGLVISEDLTLRNNRADFLVVYTNI